jgi:hypothetical protein
MSIVVGSISGGAFDGTNVNINVPTVRVPELADAELPIEDTDLLLLYKNAPTNKTRKTSIEELKNFLVTPGGVPVPPVTNGADVEIIITAAMAGTNRVNVPILANKMYSLSRRGFGTLLTNEYNILSSGGFELKPKDENGNVVTDDDANAIEQDVSEGEVFIAHVYDYVPDQGGGGIPGNTGGGGSLITGIVSITANTQLSAIHRQKLIHASFGDNKGIVTLEDIADAPENSIVIIETTVGNNFQTKVTAKTGQVIYYGSTSQQYLYLGISESIWLLRGADGWYVLNDLKGVDRVGLPIYSWKQRLNTLICRGQEVNRADYPRLWEWVQQSGALILDTQWATSASIIDAETGTRQIYYPYKGCFSYGVLGTGGATFRLPDEQGMFRRGLANIGSTDAERTFNTPGNIQPDTNRKHSHDINYEINGSDGAPNAKMIPPNTSGEGTTNGTDSAAIQPAGGFESRPINIGFLPLIYV